MVGPEDKQFDLNPTRAAPHWPPAAIAGGFQTGVLGIRTLIRRGVRAVCVDCNPRHPGFRSVYGPARLCPSPDTDPDGWVQFMRELARGMQAKPVLISSSDQFVTAIAQHAPALEESYVFSPASRLKGLLADKQTQYELAALDGMPMLRIPRHVGQPYHAEPGRLRVDRTIRYHDRFGVFPGQVHGGASEVVCAQDS